MFDSLPVFAVCGYSGSGKTTLLERLVPRLIQSGLRVAVVKHDVHGIEHDLCEKDSHRLFRSGADVVAIGPGESLARTVAREDTSLETEIGRLVDRYDLVLLEGFKRWRGRKAWLLRPDQICAPKDCGPFDLVLPWESDRVPAVEGVLQRFVVEQADRTPVFGCVLIGGRSSRMGRAKHLLPSAGAPAETWLHRTVRVLQACCAEVVLAGSGEVPGDLGHLSRLPDPPGTAGPMAGLLAALRWAPRASWVLASCDLPLLSPRAVRWILSLRRPGVWAVLPRRSEDDPVEPLLAWYDFRCRETLELLATADTAALRRIAQHPKCRVALIPRALANAWQDADTPEQAGRRTIRAIP